MPDFWQNLGDYDPALWIPFAALTTQNVAVAELAILAPRWQERVGDGRSWAVR